MSNDDYKLENVKAWQGFSDSYIHPGEEGWKADNPHWGIWSISESELKILPNDLKDKACLELGCGTGYVSSWMARRGAKVTGIDPTPNQLLTAKRLEEEHDLGIKFIEAFAEDLPFLDSSFDFAISEYGASLWADPYKWIPEAARVLKPGSQLIFMTNHALAICCTPDEEDQDAPLSEKLLRPYLGLYKNKWEFSSNETEFHLTHGEWIKLLRKNNFNIEKLLELGAPDGASSRYSWANADWASKWPTEEVWFVRLSK